MSPHSKAWIALVATTAVVGALVFAAAGAFAFWRGWVFLAVFFAASVALTADLAARDPALLERRIHGGPWAETRPAQRIAMAVVSAGFLALLIAPPLAWRHGQAPTSAATSLAGDALLALGYAAIARVFRANSYAAATVRTGDGQRVVSIGPYAWVRHPMYAASLAYLIGIPLALGSWWGLVVVLFILPFLIWRLVDEEQMLTRQLPGYAEYMNKTPWRLIPGLF